jgi:hypothetical protein
MLFFLYLQVKTLGVMQYYIHRVNLLFCCWLGGFELIKMQPV